MTCEDPVAAILENHVVVGNHKTSNYFAALKELVQCREQADDQVVREHWQQGIDEVYALVREEILTNTDNPVNQVNFGTSGWRGMLGKDIFVRSVATVTCAILNLYAEGENNPEIFEALGNIDFAAMQKKGCVVGFDNRFGGEILALAVMNVLAANGVKVLYAGEATTGALSASVMQRGAAFSVNLTPSHNPMEYGGFKYNAADAGPAAPILTDSITSTSKQYLDAGTNPYMKEGLDLQAPLSNHPGIVRENALESWQHLIMANKSIHGVDYSWLTRAYAANTDMVVCVDSVHGASRNYIQDLLNNPPEERLILLRNTADCTFGGIAPEPSSNNMQFVIQALQQHDAPLKVGAIIDPDADRIRFTDGTIEISMNQFGAMAYHYLHEVKGKKGMVAKTVASSNLANAIARRLNEKIFEPKVGFKEFKPVMGKALVFFEESDGISIIGHTPEKDAFIGLILAIDMVQTLGISLGQYLHQIETTYGHYHPDRGGIEVSQQGEALTASLKKLEAYKPGVEVMIGPHPKKIKEVIDIDGRKIIFNDDSWLMIRPSGTEPKVRFYVEARDALETAFLVERAHSMLAETGVLP
ncbi:MAG: phosphoglucomutase [Desulfobulbus propionicus]|nr:MAG: phosphoglucomutase [Desulfobulbus propionicus]